MADSPSSTVTLASNPVPPEQDKPNLSPQPARPCQLPPPPRPELQQPSPPQSQVMSNPPWNLPLVSPFPSFPSYAPPSMAGPDPVGVRTSAPPFRTIPPLHLAFWRYAPMPNGYAVMAQPGVPRYPSPYMPMIRPAFAPRPPGAVGIVPEVPRPFFPRIFGACPIIPPVTRPAIIPTATPEKPQTTVYVGKISPSVENEFMLNLLQLCGPVKSWKRVDDPTNGTLKGFGFCEFATAEGVLRALRLLNKFNVDGQELVLNINQSTKEYLEWYVEMKTETWKKIKEAQGVGAEKEDGNASGAEKSESAMSAEGGLKKDDHPSGNKENQDTANFGIVTVADRVIDREASEKLASKIQERLKARPLQLPAANGYGNLNSEQTAKSNYGDTDVDMMIKDATKGKNDDDMTSDKPTSEQDRPETISPDWSRRNDKRSKDKGRDQKSDKERKIKRYEKEADRERTRKERDQRRKTEEAEREFADRLKEWEYRESRRKKHRRHEKEREIERECKRKREIYDDEEEDDDDDDGDDSRKRGRRSEQEEKRKRTLREMEEDLADRQREEEEVAEAKRAEEELMKQQQQQRDALKLLPSHVMNGSDKTLFPRDFSVESKNRAMEEDNNEYHHTRDGSLQNGIVDDSILATVAASDTHQGVNAPAKKLGFGLVGSGKKHAVPSVFHEDDDAQKEERMRPLVPIKYSIKELQALQPTVSGAQPPNLAAVAEFAKLISNVNSKEEKADQERERGRRSHDRPNQRDRDQNDEGVKRTKDDIKDKVHDQNGEHGVEKVKKPVNRKILDAKQLIDMIPKTKKELFSYEINWAVYDEHQLHEIMKPWISKKIIEFLGEEEPTLVDYIVSRTREHVKASQMLELLQPILDDEAEMFVLKMWRMLIFETKKVETGLSVKSRTWHEFYYMIMPLLL